MPAAGKELASLSKAVRDRVVENIRSLAFNPRPSGCKALQGQFKGLHRIRSGQYRIIYQIKDDRLIVTLIRIGDRRDVYRPR